MDDPQNTSTAATRAPTILVVCISMPTNNGSKDEPITVTFEALTTKMHTTRHKSAGQKPLSERGHMPPSDPSALSPRPSPHRPSRQPAESANSPTDKGALPQSAWATTA